MGYDECRCHREIRKMNEKQMLDEAPTLKISNLQDWLDRLPDVPVFIEMDGCIAGATHLSIYHDHIVIGCPESGDV